MNAVEAEGVTVRFRPIGGAAPTLRHRVAQGRVRRLPTVTALDNITFSVRKGEAYGVIGPNGAGKSTLMRVLARTLRPDAGVIRIDGETSALLQLGVGFNHQLSGSQNVYLGSLAMGMSKAEVDERYDSIVGFAELGDSLERPLNTYSSGMTARLAFSISMHMKPSVLLVDEVLAVGDEYFREKSLSAMQAMLASAGTIVFVSHALEAVRSFCDRVLWLDSGTVKLIGSPDAVVTAYQAATT